MQSQPLKVLFLNLPHPAPLMRRYMCTYASPLFLLPPHELLQLATCAREWNNAQIRFLDAIAEARTEQYVFAVINEFAPDVLVALAGVESIGDDVACMDRIKAAFPALPLITFGYYPTTFPEEILRKSRVDFILRGEPEEALSAYLFAKIHNEPFHAIPALAGRRPDGAIFANPEQRIEDLDRLPFPDYALVDVRRYAEALLGGPCGAILSARGCPFQCSYCTTTFSRRLVLRSPEKVVEEMELLVDRGAKIVRFLDDTFTVNKHRVIDICKLILERNLTVQWACLSRVDTLDREMLSWMKRAGCTRILVGVEHYSKKVLDYLKKRLDPKTINPQLQLIRDAGIESVGFILLGSPVETEEDFQDTYRGIMDSPLDFIGVNILTPYAGTPFFEMVKDDIVFSLVPYECRFKDDSIARNAAKRERKLYRDFYLRPITIWRQIGLAVRFPYRSIRLIYMMLRYQGMKFRVHERPDLL